MKIVVFRSIVLVFWFLVVAVTTIVQQAVVVSGAVSSSSSTDTTASTASTSHSQTTKMADHDSRNKDGMKRDNNDWQVRYAQHRQHFLDGMKHHDVPIESEEAYNSIVERDERRKRFLQDKIQQHRRMLQDHLDGRRHPRRLTTAAATSDRELLAEVLRRKIRVYQEHLDRLTGETRRHKTAKVREMRESYFNMHRIDELDFTKTGLRS